MKTVVKSIASSIPQKCLSNDDLAMMVDTNDKWIVERTGIKTRYIAEDEKNSDLCMKAGDKAIVKAKLSKEEIDCLIVATCTPDQPNPATACFVAHKLGLGDIPAFDMNAMCTGFLYALQIAQGWIESNIYKNVLVIGGEKLSDIVNWKDRSTCIIFGDGAGAAVISQAQDDDTRYPEVIGTEIASDGSQSHLLGVEGKISSNKPLYLSMRGSETYKYAVTNLLEISKKILQKYDFSVEDVDWLVPHQANIRILQAVAHRCQIPMEKLANIIDRYGNTSAASIPMALVDYEEQFKKNDLLLCPAFGGGLTYGASLIRW